MWLINLHPNANPHAQPKDDERQKNVNGGV
jgi:hypothetical protein